MGSTKLEESASGGIEPSVPVSAVRFDRIAVPIALAVVLLGFVAASLYYNVTNPLWEAPDEPAHMEHVLFLVENHDLPVRQVKQGDQLHQPPLYYVAAALVVGGFNLDDHLPIKPNPYFIWRTERIGDQPNLALHTLDESMPYQGTVLAVHALRALSLLFCAVAVWVAYRLTRLVLPSRPWLAVAAAAFTAFTPQFLYVSATLGNDGPAIAFGSLALLSAVDLALRASRGEKAPKRLFTLLGLWLGLGVLSKLTFFGILPLIAVVALYTIVMARGKRLHALGNWTLSGLVAAAVGGWWFVRNLLVYGTTFDIIGKGRFDPRTTLEIQEKPEQMAKILAWYPEPLFQSYWLRFGWMNIYPERWVYDLAIAICLLAVMGLGLYVALRVTRRDSDVGASNLGLILCAVALFSTLAITTWRFAYTIGNHYPQGRYLFPAQPATALLMVLGLATMVGLPLTLARFWSRRPERWRNAGRLAGVVASLTLALALGSTSAMAVDRYIKPNYSQLPIWLRYDPAQIPNPLDIRYGGQVSLIGYDVAEDSVTQGDSILLDLYWRAETEVMADLQAFVHVADASGKPVAQKDGPAGGDYPITSWRQGEVIRDRRVVPVDAQVAPDTYHVFVGLYSLQTMQRVPLSGTDGQTAAKLGTVTVLTR